MNSTASPIIAPRYGANCLFLIGSDLKEDWREIVSALGECDFSAYGEGMGQLKWASASGSAEGALYVK